MHTIQLAVSATALAAFIFGIARVARRLGASEISYVARRHAVDALAAVALVGSLAALVQARWWASAAFEPANWLIRVLFVGWILTAVIGGSAAVVRLIWNLFRLAEPESRAQKIERNLATFALAVGGPAAAIIASAVHAPVHNRNDEIFVLHQVRDYERIAELRMVARSFGTGDPEVARALDLAVPSHTTEAEVRRLFDRWDLADDPEYMRSAFALPADASAAGLEPACVDQLVIHHMYWLTRWSRPEDDGLTDHTQLLADVVDDENWRAHEPLMPLTFDLRPGCSVVMLDQELVLDVRYVFWKAGFDLRRAESGD